jgi:hypothetical protein
MVTQIQKWLDIAITHTYFPNSVCEVLQLVPTAETASVLKNYGIVTRAFSNICSLYCALDMAGSNTIAQQLAGMPNLCFQVFTTSPVFANYSDLPLSADKPNQYFFANGVNPADPTALQATEFVSAADLIVLYPLKFQLAIPAVKKVTLTVTDSAGKTVLTQQADGTLNHRMDVNLSPFGAGQYQLKLQKNTTRIFASASVAPANSIGVLQLQTESLLAMIQEDKPIHLQLAFNARSAFWKYAVVVGADKQIDIQSMNIEDSAGNAYTGPVSEPIAGGATASVYTSPKAMLLQSTLPSGQLLKVSYTNSFSARVVEMNVKLPFPDVARLSVTQAPKRDPTFFSSKIINI